MCACEGMYLYTSTRCPFPSNLISEKNDSYKNKKKAFPVNEQRHLLCENIGPFLLRIKHNIHLGHRETSMFEYMHHVMKSIKYPLPLGKGQRSMTFAI